MITPSKLLATGGREPGCRQELPVTAAWWAAAARLLLAQVARELLPTRGEHTRLEIYFAKYHTTLSPWQFSIKKQGLNTLNRGLFGFVVFSAPERAAGSIA